MFSLIKGHFCLLNGANMTLSDIWSCVLRYFDLLRSRCVVLSTLVLFLSFQDIETFEDVQSYKVI
jgi:hypothetical protein